MKRYFAGVLTVIVLVAVIGFLAVWMGYVPAAADAPKPSNMERMAASHSLGATIAREAPSAPYPFGPATDATIASGAKLYIDNCAVCHGSAGSEASKIAKGLYVAAPQFTKHGVDDDPEGETYWKIEHGIRFTGMPAFKDVLPEETIWQITYFLKRGAENLPPEADAIWHRPHGD
jgi:thiosulfate dehydrogenase